ncbi:hypothetical protein [Arthrobacter sp. A2-55]|uniref:hypothetical protein n=1 Tax=Arthrobacter sp. A2-55 TaxID=2897337 RepID=UPI0021CD7366|nr:hypothetical protein [Arthrobacter sp. A2-55]MCU6479019.1 hypothetical protein [Arthrobacter sp. A2-55]
MRRANPRYRVHDAIWAATEQGSRGISWEDAQEAGDALWKGGYRHHEILSPSRLYPLAGRLNELGPGSVVMVGGQVFLRGENCGFTVWHAAGEDRPRDTEWLIHLFPDSPVTILHDSAWDEEAS